MTSYVFRHLREEYRSLQHPQHNILDGQILWRFLELSMKDRQEIASRIGTTSEQVRTV